MEKERWRLCLILPQTCPAAKPPSLGFLLICLLRTVLGARQGRAEIALLWSKKIDLTTLVGREKEKDRPEIRSTAHTYVCQFNTTSWEINQA
ncbi:hypothetical protein PVK06_038135 [Gossypium arboreum]|uniref:Secreted protein n=1 Tax=Gossypium arboreum TaxID=29729 RepID=A0ABR0MZA2_GOSAR|nr:hypothetical protein PVK06_038135 [Gossypium arboreum]